MYEENKRIKQIRSDKGLSMRAFGARIGVSDSTIALIESEKRNVTDRVIKDVSREFRINEDWLKYGIGEPYLLESRSENIAEFVGRVINEGDESFRNRFINVLANLNDDQWGVLESMGELLLQQQEEKSEK